MPVELARASALLRAATRDAEHRINLVPSEARMSPLAREPIGGDLYFRYFFNEDADPHFWQFRGGHQVGHLEHALAIPALRRLSGAAHVNIRPLSGLNAMLLVISALGGEMGDTVVCVDPGSGGHFATTSVVERLGRRPVTIGVRDGIVDGEQLVEALSTRNVALVYLDLQNALVQLDIPAVADVIRHHSPDTILHVDSSHTLGLVLGRAHRNPLECGADSFGGSTHKSFPGPQKGVLLTHDQLIADKLKAAQFDLVSSHHFAETLALGLAAAEFETFGERYASRVIANARTLARSLRAHDFDIAGCGPELTGTHQVWMWHGPIDSVARLSDRLAAAGIAINIQDDLPGRPGPAIRLGVNESTFEGAGTDAMETIADAFAQARDGEVRLSAADVRATYGPPHYFSAPAGAGDDVDA